jgi:hypothetical protein
VREWLLGLLPVALLIDFVINPAHLSFALNVAKNLFR